MNTRLLKSAILTLGVLAPFAVMAQDEESVSVKKDYIFVRPDTPRHIEPYNTTAYIGGKRTVTTLRGDNLLMGKDSIANFALNPAGINYSTLTVNKKGEVKLAFYSTAEENFRVWKFDTKKYGMPTSVAYTPDARQVAVATERGIYIFDTRKFELKNQMELVPVHPTAMTFSPNGYYLALTEGSKVVVYNFEERKIRQRWDFEVTVTDVNFSPDSQQMGVLTDDGLLTIFDTRRFDVRTTVDDLGEGLAFAFNESGKYIAVATSPSSIEVINLLKQEDREKITVGGNMCADLAFINDASGKTLLAYGSTMAVNVRRMSNLEPYYAKLVSDEVDLKMAEWEKMLPGETMEEYSARISDENRRKQRRLFEDEISTSLAGDMLSMAGMSLGKYNSDKELLAVDFTNMPTIYLPVAKADISSFHDAADLTVSEAQYGLLPDDSFELIYAKFNNKNDGKTYVYDNVDRVAMSFLEGDDNVVSLEVLQQQQMEEMKLQELKEKVVQQARHENIISDHTHISADTRVVPDYDANGNKILNYVVKFTYEVEPDFSAVEDFAPGKYKVDESGAASSMLQIVKQAFEGDMAQYLKEGKKILINLSGTADATPIVRGIPYDGAYGDIENEPIRQNGELTGMTVTKASGIKTNEQLAFLRALGVKHNLENKVEGLKNMNCDYRYDISVSQDKGSEFRRITAEFTIFDVF